MKFYLKQFDLTHLRVIYDQGIDHEAMIKQWVKSKDWERAAHYAAKLEGIIELLESITVFNLGDGLGGFKNQMGQFHGLEARLHSFETLFQQKKAKA